MGMNDRYKKFRRSGRRKPKRVRTTPTQQQTFTLPDGSEIILPELPSEQSRITLSYPEAGFEYQSDLSSAASLMILGTIFVDGEESTNPGDCRIAWYIDDNHSISCGHVGCYGTCDNGGAGDYSIDPNYPLNCVLPAIHGNGGCNYFPNHSQTSAYSPSGNADAIAIMWRGQVQGWDYVNNIVQSTNEGIGQSRNQLTGIVIGMTGVSSQNGFDSTRYISSGDMIEDLILYRASTGTHHRLTDESYDRIFSNVIPYNVSEFVYMGFDNAFIQTLAPDNPSSPLGNEVSREIIQVPGPCNDWNHDQFGLISPSGELCDGVCGTGYSEGTNHFYSLASNYCNEGANPGSQDDYAECECVEWEIPGGGYIADNSYDDYSLGTNEIHFGPPITDTPDILPGDTNVDGTLNVQDIVIMVNMILTEIPGEEIAQLYPQADMNGDGAVNVLDVVTLAQLILNNPTTSSRDRQELQRQLDRLDDGTQRGGNVGRNTQRNRKFRRRRR